MFGSMFSHNAKEKISWMNAGPLSTTCTMVYKKKILRLIDFALHGAADKSDVSDLKVAPR